MLLGEVEDNTLESKWRLKARNLLLTTPVRSVQCKDRNWTDLKYIEMHRNLKYTQMHHIYLFIFFSDPLSMNIKFKDSCSRLDLN